MRVTVDNARRNEQWTMNNEQIDYGPETPPPLVANPDGDKIDGAAAMGNIAYGPIH